MAFGCGHRVWPGLVLSLALQLLVGAAAQGGSVYVWTDRYGVTHLSQEPPPAGVEARRMGLSGGRGGAPSPRLQRIRCRDFRGALEQLDALDDVAPDNPRWLAARERARRGIGEWCER